MGNRTGKTKTRIHDCEFTKKHTALKWIFPGDSKCARFRRAFRGMFLISEKNGRKCFNQISTTGYIFERERHLTNHYYMIHPYSNFRLYWEILILAEFYYALVLHIMLKAMFYSDKYCTFYPILTRFLFDLLETSDIVLRFFTGYVNKTSQTVSLNIKKVFWNNVKSRWLIVDLAGAFPFQSVYYVTVMQCPDTFLNFITIIKIVRIRIFYLYIKHLAKIYQWTDRRYQIVTMFTWALVGCFWLTSIYYKILTYDPEEETWLETFKLESDSEKYFMIFYSVFSILMLQNGLLGTVEIADLSDLMFYSFLLMVAYIWTAIGIGIFVFFYGLRKSSKMKYDEMIQAVRKYMIHKDLPKELQKKILAYYEFRFQRVFFRESDILQTISEPLRNEIAYFCGSHFFLDKESVFAKLPKEVIEQLCVAMKPKIYMTNDIIATAGEEATKIYVVGCGTVGTYNSSGREVDHLHEGSQFGLVTLMRTDNHIFTYIALEPCEIFTISYDDYLNAVGNNKEYMDVVIRAVIKKRNAMIKNMKREKQFNDFYDYDRSEEGKNSLT